MQRRLVSVPETGLRAASPSRVLREGSSWAPAWGTNGSAAPGAQREGARLACAGPPGPAVLRPEHLPQVRTASLAETASASRAPPAGEGAAVSLGLRGPAVADAHARRGWPCGARQPRLAVAGMGHTATLRCGRVLVAGSESACSHGAGPMRYSKQCFYLMMNGLIQRKLFKVISTIKTSI